MANTQTWEIEDANGKRRVTLAEFRAELNARHAETRKIAAAWRSGDIKATEKAQAEFRKRFS